MISTPYGCGEVVKINWCYGVKVKLKRNSWWFAFWEVSW